MPGPAASRRRDPCWAAGMLVLALSFFSGDQVLGKTKTQPPVVRWAEGQPGCTFARGDDGKYRWGLWSNDLDRKSTRLNSSHMSISYAVFCLKKKKKNRRCSTYKNEKLPPRHTYHPS